MAIVDPELPWLQASDPGLEADKKLPDQFVLAHCPVEFLQAEDGDADSLPKVEMVAYNGGIMRVGFWGDVLVDIQGMRLPRQVKFLADHVRAVRTTVGFGKAEAPDNTLRVSGVLSRVTEDAKIIAAMAAEGLEWEASVGIQPLIWQYIRPGESVEANGRTFKATSANGGFMFIKRSILKEVSILPAGADEKTRVKIAAEAALLDGGNAMKFDEWLKAKGFEPDALGEEQKTLLKASYDAEIKAAAEKVAPKPVKAASPAPEVPPVKAAATADPPAPEITAADQAVQEVRAALAKETARVAKVHELCAGHADIEAKAVGEGWSVEKTELEVLRASRPAATLITGSGGTPPDMLVMEAAVRMGGVEGSAMVEKAYKPEVLEAADRFRHIGLKELIAAACAMDGVPGPRIGASPNDYLQAAFSTVSLAGILGNTANKAAIAAYNTIESAAKRVCAKLSANDFKTHTAYRLTGNMVPPEVGADGELKHAVLGEADWTYRIATYGLMLTLTRQTIINDDLQMFTQLPKMFGRGCALLVEELFFTLYHANTGDFFHADNNNLITDAFASGGLSTAVQTLVEQTDADGKPIVLNPKTLLVPPALKTDADELYVGRNLVIGGGSTKDRQPDPNIHAGKYQPVTSPYMSNTGFHASASSTAWSLFGDPADIAAFGLAYLKGNETPVFESVDMPSNVLGKGWRGYFDIGCCQMEPEGAVRSTGAGA